MTESQEAGGEQLVVEREIAAPAEHIFAVLADPRLHPATDASGMVRGSEASPITAVGERFEVAMHASFRGGDDVSSNEVIAFEQDRAIGWRPSEPGAPAGGWTWSYALEERGPGRTLVRLAYDWSAVAPELRERIGFPALSREQLEGSLAKLAEQVEGSQPGGMQSIVAPGAAAGQRTTLAGSGAADVSQPHEFTSSADGRRR